VAALRLAIVGSRRWPSEDLDLVREYVRKLPKGTTVITGGDDGTSGPVDQTAAEEARACGLDLTIFWPDTEVYGPVQAPIMRNRQIVEDCTELVAFWADGKSPGTANVVRLAAHAGKLRETVRPRVRA
jgi:hypothetical protein